MFEDQTISVPCPNCGKETAKKIGWLRTHSYFNCTRCRTRVVLNKDKKSFAAVHAIDKILRKPGGFLGKKTKR